MRQKNQQCCGTSLVEVLIASAVVGLILVCTAYLLQSCFRHFREVDSAVQVHLLATTSLARIEEDLRHANPASYQIFTNPPGIVFGSPRDNAGKIQFDPDSLQPLWRKLVCYYLEPDGSRFRLVRKEQPLTTIDDQPPAVGTNDTSHFQLNVTGGGVIARGVESLVFTDGSPLELELTLSDISHEGSSTESLFRVQVETKIALDN